MVPVLALHPGKQPAVWDDTGQYLWPGVDPSGTLAIAPFAVHVWPDGSRLGSDDVGGRDGGVRATAVAIRGPTNSRCARACVFARVRVCVCVCARGRVRAGVCSCARAFAMRVLGFG